MKKMFFVAALVMSASVIPFYSCKKDSTSSTTGPKFTAARNLIRSKCAGSGCHIGSGNSAGGYNFDTDASIVNNYAIIAAEINTDGMPLAPQSPLTAAEKAVINEWIAAGARVTD